MEQRRVDFESDDEGAHRFAAEVFIGEANPGAQQIEFLIEQGGYAYRVQNGHNGHVYYRRPRREWILVANWCFYGLYVVVRYRKALWLRPFYRHLFSKMNFKEIEFEADRIVLRDGKGAVTSGRYLRLTPPRALENMLAQKFEYSAEKIEQIKKDLGWSS